MKVVIQRVLAASVLVEDEVLSEIAKGLMVLVGITHSDTKDDLEWLAAKVAELKLFTDKGKHWKASAKDLRLPILCVSQFTLHGYTKGKRPDFHAAMGAEKAEAFYNDFLQQLRKRMGADELVLDGKFGAYMQVSIQNDGPVTMLFDSENRKPPSSSAGKKKVVKEAPPAAPRVTVCPECKVTRTTLPAASKAQYRYVGEHRTGPAEKLQLMMMRAEC